MKNKKKQLDLSPTDRNRLENARWLADNVGGIAPFARRLGRPDGDTLIQNYIGKTPTKRIGRIMAPAIESKFELNPGELDRDWNHGGPPSWSNRIKSSAEPTPHETSETVAALGWIVERMIAPHAARQATGRSRAPFRASGRASEGI
jgi:hypothetical protein